MGVVDEVRAPSPLTFINACRVSSLPHYASRSRVAPRSFIAWDITLRQGGAVYLSSAIMCTIVQTKFLDNECYVSGPPPLSPFQCANLADQKPLCFVVTA